jgi:MurNAc alpha-1-phosphate uridylyltransferase
VHAKTVMILAAGRGERMRPLTDSLPKPLLTVGGKPVVVWQLERLARAGFRRAVINHAHLGEMIEAALGDGSCWGLELSYSAEPEALESAGGIRQALPLIASESFAVVNADVYTDYDYRLLSARLEAMQAPGGVLAHLVLVDNPAHHPVGDFYFKTGRPVDRGSRRLTYSGIGAYRIELFERLTPGAKHRLAPLISEAIASGRASAEHHRGVWFDVGTPQRLAQLDAMLTEKQE